MGKTLTNILVASLVLGIGGCGESESSKKFKQENNITSMARISVEGSSSMPLADSNNPSYPDPYDIRFYVREPSNGEPRQLNLDYREVRYLLKYDNNTNRLSLIEVGNDFKERK